MVVIPSAVIGIVIFKTVVIIPALLFIFGFGIVHHYHILDLPAAASRTRVSRVLFFEVDVHGVDGAWFSLHQGRKINGETVPLSVIGHAVKRDGLFKNYLAHPRQIIIGVHFVDL